MYEILKTNGNELRKYCLTNSNDDNISELCIKRSINNVFDYSLFSLFFIFHV